jgi:copper transport protein
VRTPDVDLWLEVTPARVGRNRIELRFTERGGQPLEALEAELSLSLPEQGVEALRVEARPEGAGRFVAPSVSLPLPGTWEVQADLLVDDFTKLSFRTRIEVSP